MKRGNTIGSSELSSRGHDVVALVAVAFYVNPLVHVTILDHHHQTGPTLSQVIGGHAFSALREKFICYVLIACTSHHERVCVCVCACVNLAMYIKFNRDNLVSRSLRVSVLWPVSSL